jgi:CheY-like chemotaxis protein
LGRSLAGYREICITSRSDHPARDTAFAIRCGGLLHREVTDEAPATFKEELILAGLYPGEKNTVSVRVSCVWGKRLTNVPNPSADIALQQAKRRILVVEDEIIIRLMIPQYLRDSGFDVIEANNAQDAVRVLLELKVDLVFTDVQMPGSMDGIDLARRIRTEWPDMKVILTSGAVTASALPADLRDYATLVQKPYRLDAIEEQIRVLLLPEKT